MRPSAVTHPATTRQAGGSGSGPETSGDPRPPKRPEERLRFERLLTDLSATFVNVPADQVDAQIEDALRRLVEFLGVERGSLAEFDDGGGSLNVTHCYAVPGLPPAPRVITAGQLPWYTAQVRGGEVLRFGRMPDDLPTDAAHERAFALATGIKSHLVIPLQVGGDHLASIGFGAFRAYRDWPDGLVQRLRLAGEILASAVARERADRALKAREEASAGARTNSGYWPAGCSRAGA